MECVSAVSRHWKALTGELNAAKQRIGGASGATPPVEEVSKVFEGILELSKAVTEPVSGIDSTLSEACASVKALMIEVAQAVEQANAKHAQGMAELAAGGDDAIKAKLGEVVKEMEGKDKLLDEMRARLRALEDGEATRADEVATAKGRANELSERLEQTRHQLETADRRLAKSEGRYRVLENQYKNAPKAEAGSTAGGAGGGAGAG
jgi:chromosome segregation ATPase